MDFVMTSFGAILARLACVPKGLYILRQVFVCNSYIFVIVSQIITKFGQLVR